MSSCRHVRIKHLMGFITLFSGKRLSNKKYNSHKKSTSNMVSYERLVIVHEYVHELKEHQQHFFEPLFITHIVR